LDFSAQAAQLIGADEEALETSKNESTIFAIMVNAVGRMVGGRK
jgi:hypothetical protein